MMDSLKLASSTSGVGSGSPLALIRSSSLTRRSSFSPRPRVADVAPSAAGLRIVVCASYEELSEKAATLLAARLLLNPAAHIALSVGATPTGTYRQLAALADRGIAPLEEAHFYLLDEFFQTRLVADAPAPAAAAAPGTSPGTSSSLSGNERLAAGPHFAELQRSFFLDAHLSDEQLHRPDASLPPQAAADAYKELLNLRRLDYAVVGLGPRGGIGWLNEPQPGGVAVHPMSPSSRDSMGYDTCVSLGMDQLRTCKELFVLAVNRNKADVVARALADTKGATPAGHLIYNHPAVTLLLDVTAAHELISKMKLPPVHVPGFSIMAETPEPAIKGKRVVCFSPHPDDTSISSGATLVMLGKSNHITSCICTTGHRAYIPGTTTAEERIAIREREATEEAILLGAHVHFLRLPLYNTSSLVADSDVRLMEEYLVSSKPDLIFLPQTGDTHQTHRAVLKTILLALLQMSNAGTLQRVDLYLYEGPWSLFSKGSYNVISSPGAECFAKKLAAIGAHKSQTARTAYDRAADSLALLRGALVPEQDLGGWGENPPKLQDRLELFFKRTVLGPADLQILLSWLEQNQAPKRA